MLSRLTLNESNGWIDERAIEAALGRLHCETARNDADSGIEIDRSLHELQRTHVLIGVRAVRPQHQQDRAQPWRLPEHDLSRDKSSREVNPKRSSPDALPNRGPSDV